MAELYGLSDVTVDFFPRGEIWDPVEAELWLIEPVKKKIAGLEIVPEALASGSRDADVTAEVVYVSADTLKEKTARGEEIYYRVHVSTQTSPVTTTTGRVLEILPGMTAQVDIRTGDRTVMDYLLKPLRKTLSNAFGER